MGSRSRTGARRGAIVRGVVAAALAAWQCHVASGATYRVGPGEKYSRVSQVAPALTAGDVVEVTGDISDRVILTRSGTEEKPIIIRGVTRVEEGRIRRPRVTPAQPITVAFTCIGDWNTIEGLELAGNGDNGGQRSVGIVQEGNHLTVRNCYFHHFNFKALLGSPHAGSITVEFCEFDSCGSVPGNGKTADVWSWTPGAVMRVEHCYFHDSLNECLLKTHCTRNVIRYNWFENSYSQAVKVTDRIGEAEPQRPESVYPMHSDIVGNVFIQGESPGPRFAVISAGGQAEDEPGTEGDFYIAHNLFITSRARSYGDPSPFVHVPGNADRVMMYNNVFVQMGGTDAVLYTRGETWDTQETREFIARRGSGEPIVEGSNNWVFSRCGGIPEGLKSTIRGLNPKMVDLLNGDYRPRSDSPLAGAGVWPLPMGRVVDLIPEYEPQWGIPPDLKPRPRRKAVPPSIGPFEADEE